MVGNGRRDRMEKPLVGAVLCCTSIPPEHRTRYAEIATQMGAEHKLDLTSDVTHLIVGDINTPKYKYVAREREDVKVLSPEWLEAVRQSWMTAEAFDLQELEEKYKLPVFAGLSVCVTGFDDVAFRAQLQAAIIANGGDYRGDLTRTVTHLIANAPQGKKYEYAVQWEIRIVSLRWLKDSVDRGMVLEESLYHPTLPASEQGNGAWNRNPKSQVHLGKRPRDESFAGAPPRKLRRTASAKLGSQSDTLWGDIMGGGFDTEPEPQIPLRPSQSLPTLKPTVLEPESFIMEGPAQDTDIEIAQKEDLGRVNILPETRQGCFVEKMFFFSGFPSRKEPVIRKAVTGGGATVVDSLIELNGSRHLAGSSFVVVPYDLSTEMIPPVDMINPSPSIVTDMWIERCMHTRSFLNPDEHPASTPVKQFPIRGFRGLSINSTGFEGIELLHISKLVKLLGARYDETLKPGISVLLCKKPKANPDKQYHARDWGIPVVSHEWLWASLQSGQLQPFSSYDMITSKLERRSSIDPREKNAVSAPISAGNIDRQQESRKLERNTAVWGKHDPESTMSARDMPDLNSRGDREQQQQRPGTDFYEGPGPAQVRFRGQASAELQRDHECTRHVNHPGTAQPSHTNDVDDGLPLQETSTNSPPKAPAPYPPRKKKPLFRSLDGGGSFPNTDTAAEGDPTPPPAAPVPTSTEKTQYIPPQTDTINGAIQELLNRKSKSRGGSAAPSASEGGKKTRLLGRALSNISNSSREGGSYAVQPISSRASSVDSVNTDGIGSVINGDMSQPAKPQSSSHSMVGRSGSFTGRAMARTNPDPTEKHASTNTVNIDLVDSGLLYRDEFAEEEPTPPMTQLGYGEHEDAIRIREKLAEKRRLRAREGGGEETGGAMGGGGEGRANLKEREVQEKRIKDDEALLGLGGGGWGVGRRTRGKDKSPKVMVDF